MLRTSSVLIGVVLLCPPAVMERVRAQEAAQSKDAVRVALMRVPDRGIQPQVLTDAAGDVHLLYFTGEHGAGDLYYARMRKGMNRFSTGLKVNSQPQSALATGNMRGGQLALGKNGRVHVAWTGSARAKLKVPADAVAMYCARLNDAGTAFEPQRNVVQEAFGVDGGSFAADALGNVCIVWHAPAPGTKGESNRAVWIARSTDEGRTFAKETRANAEATGVCGCCGLRALIDGKGRFSVLYRSAPESARRDVHLLYAASLDAQFQNIQLDTLNTAICPMSTFSLAETPQGLLAAWDNDGAVSFARIDSADPRQTRGTPAPGQARNRKHPVLAANADGQTLLVWTEGMGWNRGGSAAWQVYDKAGNPTAQRGSQPGVPAFSLVAAFARPDGSFVILY